MAESLEEFVGFRVLVEELVKRIPYGRVMTYGQIAAICGNARAARIVGGIAHYGNPNLPWHRVVNKTGGLASGYPGGRASHGEALSEEGVIINDQRLDISAYLWNPGNDQSHT